MRKKKKAVALKYTPDTDDAPKVVALGQGEIAEKIINLASQKEVPVINKPELVEKLVTLDLNQEIPRELYDVVAEVLAFVYKLNKKV